MRSRSVEAGEIDERIKNLPNLILSDLKNIALVGIAAVEMQYGMYDDLDGYEIDLRKADFGVLGGIEGFGADWLVKAVERAIDIANRGNSVYPMLRWWLQAGEWLEKGYLPDKTVLLESVKVRLEKAWRDQLERLPAAVFPGDVVDFVGYIKPQDTRELLDRALVGAAGVLPDYRQLSVDFPAPVPNRSLSEVARTIGFDLRKYNRMGELTELTGKAVAALKMGGGEGWKQIRDYLASVLAGLTVEELAQIDAKMADDFCHSALASDLDAGEKIALVNKIIGVGDKLALTNPESADEYFAAGIIGFLRLGEAALARQTWRAWTPADGSEVLDVASEVMKMTNGGGTDLDYWLNEIKQKFLRTSNRKFDDSERAFERWDRELFWADYSRARHGHGFYLDRHLPQIRKGNYDDLIKFIIYACEGYPVESVKVLRVVCGILLSEVMSHNSGRRLEAGDLLDLSETLFELAHSMGDKYQESELVRAAKSLDCA